MAPFFCVMLALFNPGTATMTLYTPADADNLSTLLRTLDTTGAIGYFDVSYSDLGGEERASLIVRATSGKKEDWLYNILQNAHFAMFHLYHDGGMELFAKHHRCPKFRKCKVKSLQHAAEKITAYFQSL
jgi:hypothetical protein